MALLGILSEREFEVAEKITLGYSEKETADMLFVSVLTIHKHTYNIRKKLNARSCVDVARQFILSLDNPKQYFAAIVFLFVQSFIIVDDVNLDLRRPSTQRIEASFRAFRGSKKDFVV